MQMKHYRLDGNYGTFAITRTVLAVDEQAAFEQTGIMATLVDAGWEVAEAPEGEEWEIAEIPMPESHTPADELFANVFITAIEGGINYWASVDVYHWCHRHIATTTEGHPFEDIADWFGFYADIVDSEVANPEVGPNHHVDRAVIERGWRLACTTFQHKVRWSTASPPYMLTEQSLDGWDFDAGDADVILQLGLFGDVIYG